jgi:hypothetical protein
MAHLDTKKQEIAQNLIASKEEPTQEQEIENT